MTVIEFVGTLKQRGIAMGIRKGSLQLWPFEAWSKVLSEEERNFVRAHRAELKALVVQPNLQSSNGSVPAKRDTPLPPELAPPLRSHSQARAEPEPELYARGVRVTEADVIEAMEAYGDIEHYKAGRISKLEAYERARHRMRQAQEFRAYGY